MTGAFGYLILATARNQVRGRLARLRDPRYAFAMALGLIYLWAMYLRPGLARTPQLATGTALTTTIVPLVTLLFVSWTWLFGADRNALAFSEAEVSMLFAAPVRRRTLLLYKLGRTQLAIVGTSVVWTILFRQGPTIALAITHVIAYWVLLSTLNLNRLGAALAQSGREARGLRGLRRSGVAAALVIGALTAVGVELRSAWPAITGAGDPWMALAAVERAFADGPAYWALLPFRVAAAPLATPAGTAWLLAMGPALGLLALLLAWVLRTDAPFEETAVQASLARARRRDARRAQRGSSLAPVTSRSAVIPLAPLGPPAIALLWKNAMWVVRTGQVRSLLAPPAIAALLLAAVGPRSTMAATIIGGASAILALAMLLRGPTSFRNDLRSELLHLSVLKTYPLRGREVVLAEIASSALPLALMQYLLLLVSLAALGPARLEMLDPDVRWSVALAAPLLLAGLNGATCTVHNGIALLFPGWVRLGPTVGAGIENLGLGIINVFFSAVVLGLLLLVPAVSGAVVVGLLDGARAVGVAIGTTIAGALLLVEGVACAAWLGRVLDRLEPTAVGG